MSEVATFLNSIVSITHDIMRPSVDMVRDDVSYLDSQPQLFLPSAHPPSLIVTLSFLSFRNIRHVSIFLSFFVPEVSMLLWINNSAVIKLLQSFYSAA